MPLDPRFDLGPIWLPSDWTDEQIADFARKYGGSHRFERAPRPEQEERKDD